MGTVDEMFQRAIVTCAVATLALSGCGSNSDTPDPNPGGGASNAAGMSAGGSSAGGATAGSSTGGPAGASYGGAPNSGAGNVGGAPSGAGADSSAGGATGGSGTGNAGRGGSSNGGTGNAGRGGGSNGGAGRGGSNAGASNGGGSNGGAGASNGGSCNVAPANPKATQQAKNLLCYLYSQYGNHVLSGQQETSWSNPGNDITWYSTNGMKLPAILGGDYLYPSGTTQRAIAYWNAGGITMIRYHMGAPPGADSYANSMGTANIDNVLKAGTAENTSFNSKLDYAATELQQLQAANAAVIWAPFHEVQPNGWFWWSKGTGAQYIALWKYMFDYLTTTKGLNNLIWLTPFSGSPNSGYFPGKAYVDLSGPDTYGTNQPFTGLYTQAKGVVGATIPIPLHETGSIPDPSKMFPTAAPWLLFNIWAGYQSDGTHNTTAAIKTAYADAHLVTRDEVPSLK